MHEVMVPCRCSNVESCVMEKYVSDVRIAMHQIDMQERALRLIADVASAFATVQGIMRRKRGR